MGVPLVAKKGGTTHRRVGWIYASAMFVASTTSWFVAGLRLRDVEPGMRPFYFFLMFVGLLAFASAFHGLRVLRQKGRTKPHRAALDLGVAGALVAGSVALAAYSATRGFVLGMIFPALGLFVGGGQLAEMLKPPKDPRFWLFAHLGGMIGSCIATTTAFAVIAAQLLGLGATGLIVWIAPSVVGTAAIFAFSARYRRRDPAG